MSELAICDYFKWTLEDIDKLTLRQFNGISMYLRRIQKENKRMERKLKSTRKKR